MKGIRVRLLKRFKSLQPFHSSIDHNTPYEHIQSPQKISFQIPQNHPKNTLSIKNVIDETEDIFQECDEEALQDENSEMETNEDKCPQGDDKSVILYTTSLRGIRKTFEDCQSIKFLLDSFRIVYYERDVSMNLEFRDELWDIMSGKVIPPRLFIEGKYVGGADEVVSLHERGELKNLLQEIPRVSCNEKCKSCNNFRFVVCCVCHGSQKVFNGEGKNGSFSKCLSCNENGLIKCTLCFQVAG